MIQVTAGSNPVVHPRQRVMKMSDKCPYCKADMKCLSGSAHPNQWYCSDDDCGYQAWSDDRKEDREKKRKARVAQSGRALG